MERAGFWFAALLLLTFQIPWVSTAKKLTSLQTREVLAQIFSDNPKLKDKISMDALQKVLEETLEEQLDTLKTVLKESKVDIANLEDYFQQGTTLKEDKEGGLKEETNTSIVSIPGGLMVEQVQTTLDKDGKPMEGTNSELYIAVADGDMDLSELENDNQPAMQVSYEGSQKDNQGSMNAQTLNIGGHTEDQDKDDGPGRRSFEYRERSPVQRHKSHVLSRQKRETIVRGERIR